MKPNSVPTKILLILIVAGLAIGLAVEHQARLKLAQEHQRLEQQLSQMASLTLQNQQLSNLVAQADIPRRLPAAQFMELLRLRGETVVLRQQKMNLETAREENRQAHAALERRLNAGTGTNAIATADYWPQNSWAFAGYASPEAALQTALWAGKNGDAKTFFASIAGDLRERVEADLKGKSETEASIGMMDETDSIGSVRIIDREAQDNNTTVLTVEMDGQDNLQTAKMVMRKVGNEWRFSGPQQ
jgi:hypothetical protein